MEVKIFKDHEALSNAVADEIIALLQKKPEAVLCMASGETPRRTCQLLVEKIIQGKIKVDRLNFIGLDEWVGIPPSNTGSCHFFFQTELIDPLHLSQNRVHLFNAMSGDLSAECSKMDTVIKQLGGIDMMIVGIGMNGHIGFNEPGVSFDNYSHVANLDDMTLTVGQKYFANPTHLKHGITLGLKHLLESGKAILMANGSRKAEVIRKAVGDPVNAGFPATIMQMHSNGFVMTDQEAGELLDQKNSVLS